ncbi:MAG TPA: response regulator transcription factor [Stellaceae bacterium]|nr:response regulator transcription factor [Stellaceae bacterium]
MGVGHASSPIGECAAADRKSGQGGSNNDALGLPAQPARVYIVSETRLFREGLKAMLMREVELNVVGHGSCADALEEIGRSRPASLLLDMAGHDCFAVPRQLHAILPDLRIVAVAVAELEGDIIACAEAGICGYVAQHGTVQDLIATIMRALGGELVCPPRIAAVLFNRVAMLAADRPPSPLGEALTRREREIAGLIALGLQNKEIARRLGLGNATVKNHVHNILQKLNIRGRDKIVGRRFDPDPWRESGGATPSGRFQSYA